MDDKNFYVMLLREAYVHYFGNQDFKIEKDADAERFADGINESVRRTKNEKQKANKPILGARTLKDAINSLNEPNKQKEPQLETKDVLAEYVLGKETGNAPLKDGYYWEKYKRERQNPLPGVIDAKRLNALKQPELIVRIFQLEQDALDKAKEIERLGASLEAQSIEIESLKKERGDLTQQAKDLLTELGISENQLKEKELELKEASIDVDKAGIELTQVKGQIKDLEKEKDNLTQQVKDFSIRNNAIGNQLKEKELELKEARINVVKAETDLVQVMEQIKKLQQLYEEVVEKLQKLEKEENPDLDQTEGIPLPVRFWRVDLLSVKSVSMWLCIPFAIICIITWLLATQEGGLSSRYRESIKINLEKYRNEFNSLIEIAGDGVTEGGNSANNGNKSFNPEKARQGSVKAIETMDSILAYNKDFRLHGTQVQALTDRMAEKRIISLIQLVLIFLFLLIFWSRGNNHINLIESKKKRVVYTTLKQFHTAWFANLLSLLFLYAWFTIKYHIEYEILSENEFNYAKYVVANNFTWVVVDIINMIGSFVFFYMYYALDAKSFNTDKNKSRNKQFKSSLIVMGVIAITLLGTSIICRVLQLGDFEKLSYLLYSIYAVIGMSMFFSRLNSHLFEAEKWRRWVPFLFLYAAIQAGYSVLDTQNRAITWSVFLIVLGCKLYLFVLISDLIIKNNFEKYIKSLLNRLNGTPKD